MAPSMFAFITFIWTSSTDSIVKTLQGYLQKTVNDQQLSGLNSAFEMCKSCLKINRRLIIFGIPHYSKHQPVIDFISASHVQLGNLLQIRHSLPANHFLVPHLAKIIEITGKLILDVQKASPLSFLTLEGSCKFFTDQIVRLASNLDERFLVQCMLFVNSILDCKEYEIEAEMKDPSPAQVEANRIVNTVFSKDLVKNLCYVLITKIFPMNQNNLEEWEVNPEDYFNEEEVESWQDKKKPCAEHLFLTLMEKYREWLPLDLIAMLQPVLQGQAKSLQEVLMKDACYLAMGLGAYQFYNNIDFGSWFTNNLVRELQNSDPVFKILRRRICWLTACWVSKIPKELRKPIYEVLIVLLQEQDLVVSLSAANSLKSLIDDVDFYVEPFLQFLNPVLTMVFQLLERVEECDTKLRVLSVVTVLLQQLEEQIAPYTPKIVELLKQQWKLAQPHEAYNLLKQAIVTALTKLIQCSLPDNVRLSTYEFVIPIVKHSTDIAQPDSIYLMDEGLLLWMNVVSQASEINSPLLAIFPNIVAVMDQTFEHTKVVMRIIEEYLVIGKGEFLKLYGNALITVFSNTIGNVKDQAAAWLCKPIEIFIQLFPQESPQYLEPVLQKILAEIFNLSESTPWVVVHYINLFARILLQNPDFFFKFFQRIGIQSLINFLDVWIEKVDEMGQKKMKKLSALALSMLLVTKQPEILNYTNQILGFGISVANAEMDRSKQEDDFELWTEEEEVTTKSNSAAKKMLLSRDPLETLDVYEFLFQKVNETIALNGEPMKQAINPAVFTQLQQLAERKKTGN